MTGTYDIKRSYDFNYDRGPVFPTPPPEVPATPLKSFLGLRVRSRMDIAAGLLLNSRWVAGYARRGFDILTYKTVRSVFRPCYPPPNWVFVEDDGDPDGSAVAVDWDDRTERRGVSSAVCFGMPSKAPDTWREDVRRAKAVLGPGQILVVSVVATPERESQAADLAEDFAQCGEWAAAAGADAVEANLSCPNVCSAEGTIYQDIGLSRRISRTIRERIGTMPLLLKIGRFGKESMLRQFLLELNGVADGVTLVNGISKPVLRRDGSPVFGETFVRAGVLGRAIHGPSVQQVEAAARFVREEGLRLEIVAVGGASEEKDVEDFWAAGANAVMLGSSPMYLPDLAAEWKAKHPEW